ncbi:hypothetical protein G647_09109 [Cladophialophora carrionii CBS 160.54]|uniref:Uncharacterized protein n=1 Tax=Cladophialophora carrionii CBS 160.54 TaxID=1279043 RepID=V9CZW3_9EURO|nr:uncharacterized protein G647_09109 [Cladophialophora carrionii CBS 160.54]ETI19277.1 hypothetical protein G647_09109 [Cladophialophora carrionii CBS 160.54]
MWAVTGREAPSVRSSSSSLVPATKLLRMCSSHVMLPDTVLRSELSSGHTGCCASFQMLYHSPLYFKTRPVNSWDSLPRDARVGS